MYKEEYGINLLAKLKSTKLKKNRKGWLLEFNAMKKRKKAIVLSPSEKNALLHELLEHHYVNHGSVPEFSAKKGICESSLYQWIRKFEAENPQMAEQMKKQGKEVTPEDYKKLLQEIAELKKNLAHEKLRADFYEEMVAFGKEVYGIDLKKAGTK